MTRKTNLAFVLIFAMLIGSVSLLAINARWNRGPTIQLSGNSLVLTGKATGLGNATEVFFNVSGTLDVDSRCYTRSNNTPQAANKQETKDINTGFASPVQNGQTTVNRVLATAASTLQCPGGQRVVIENISWSITITVAPPYDSLNITISGGS